LPPQVLKWPCPNIQQIKIVSLYNMSIQAVIGKTFSTRITTGLDMISQATIRELIREEPRVFFRYRTSHTHPTFDRFLTNPPVAWSNYHRARLAHWINYPAFVTKIPFLLECNDHPLSAVSYRTRGLHEPREILRRLQDAADVYALPQCKYIAMPCEGYKLLFEHYFGEAFNHKFVNLHVPGCMPLNTPLIEEAVPKFLCLASDYELKGVDLLIEAWLGVEDKQGASLVIACPNIPADVILRASSKITFVTKGPLTNLEKHELLSQSNVSIAPMHVHGGGNIYEGMEYGHAIIYFATHTTFFRGIGEEVPVPYYFYLPSHYGVHWHTFLDFRETLKSDKRAGLFDATIEHLSGCIKRYIEDNDVMNSDRRKVFGLAHGEKSLRCRNEKLLRIYTAIRQSE